VNTSNLSLVPLRQASLCLDCETIMTAPTNCHVCGSRALLNVARALDRERPSPVECAGNTPIVPRFAPRLRARTTFDGEGNRGRKGAFLLSPNMSENSA
jgi:hypothetical protein